MKKILSAIFILVLICATLALTSCDQILSIIGGEKQDNVEEFKELYDAYKLNVASSGDTPLSYESWICSMKGAKDESGRSPEYKYEDNVFYVSYDEGDTWTSLGNAEVYGVEGDITAKDDSVSVKFMDGELYVSYGENEEWESLGTIGNIKAPAASDDSTTTTPDDEDVTNPDENVPDNPDEDETQKPEDETQKPDEDETQKPDDNQKTITKIEVSSPSLIIIDEDTEITDILSLLEEHSVKIKYEYSDGSVDFSAPTADMIASNLDTGTPGHYTINVSVTVGDVSSTHTIDVKVNEVERDELTDSDRSSLRDNLWTRYRQIVGIDEVTEEITEKLLVLDDRTYTLTTKAEADEWSLEVDSFLGEVLAYIKELEAHRCDNGHTFHIYESNNDATCTSDGTMSAKCLYCDATDTRTETGSQLPHSYERAETLPTCTADGEVKYTCNSCGDSYNSDEAKPATGHSFVDGFCTVCGDEDPDYVPFDFDTAKSDVLLEHLNKKVDYVGEGGLLPTELEEKHAQLLLSLEATTCEDELITWIRNAEEFYLELDSALGACMDGHDIILDASNSYKPLCTTCGVTYTIISLVGETPVKAMQNTVIESSADFLRENGLMLRYTYNDGSVRILPIENSDVTGSIDTSKVGIVGVLINKRTAVGYSRITVEIEIVSPDGTTPGDPTNDPTDNPTDDPADDPEYEFEPVVYEDIKLGEKYYFTTYEAAESVEFTGADSANVYSVFGEESFVSALNYAIEDGYIIFTSGNFASLVFSLDHENMEVVFYQPTNDPSTKDFTYRPSYNSKISVRLYGADATGGYSYARLVIINDGVESKISAKIYYDFNIGTLSLLGSTFYILDGNKLSTLVPTTPSPEVVYAYLSATSFSVKQYALIDSLADYLNENDVFVTYLYSDGTTTTGSIRENMISSTVDTSRIGRCEIPVLITASSGVFPCYVEITVNETDEPLDNIKSDMSIVYHEKWFEIENLYGTSSTMQYSDEFFDIMIELDGVESTSALEEVMQKADTFLALVKQNLGAANVSVSLGVSKVDVPSGSSIDEIINIIIEKSYLTVDGKNILLTREMISYKDDTPQYIPAGASAWFNISYKISESSFWGSSIIVSGIADLSNDTLVGSFEFTDDYNFISDIDIYESGVAVIHRFDMDSFQATCRFEEGIAILSHFNFAYDLVVYYDAASGVCGFLQPKDGEIIESVTLPGGSLTVFGEYSGEGEYFALYNSITVEIFYNKEDRVITLRDDMKYIISEDGTAEVCVSDEIKAQYLGEMDVYFYETLPEFGADIEAYEAEYLNYRKLVEDSITQTEYWNNQNALTDFLNSIPQWVE